MLSEKLQTCYNIAAMEPEPANNAIEGLNEPDEFDDIASKILCMGK